MKRFAKQFLWCGLVAVSTVANAAATYYTCKVDGYTWTYLRASTTSKTATLMSPSAGSACVTKSISGEIVVSSSLANLPEDAFVGITEQLAEITFRGDVPFRLNANTLGGLPVANTLKVKYNDNYAANWQAILPKLGYKNTAAINLPGLVVSIISK